MGRVLRSTWTRHPPARFFRMIMEEITRDLVGKKIVDIRYTGDYYQMLLDTGDMYEIRGGEYDDGDGSNIHITKYSKDEAEYYLNNENFSWEHKRNKG